MKLSIAWLNEYVDVHDVDPGRLADQLTNAGLAVDAVEPRNQGVRGVVVGYVQTCEPHPNADRLRVCTVDVGDGVDKTIVCGAPNVAAGQVVPVALPGSSLPGGDIGVAKLRGIESQGMICSAKELGLEVRLLPKSQTEGILVLPDGIAVGTDIVSLLGLDDTVLEIDLTPNRSDCLSIRGLAHEVGALLDRPVRFDGMAASAHAKFHPAVNLTSEGGGATTPAAQSAAAGPVGVVIDTPLCSRYEAQVVRNLKSGTSPLWMQMRLLAMGVRPISLIVDITNYVMLEWGQPLHAFDLDQVHDHTIVVRQGNSGEEVVTLDGEIRTLTEDTIVISDVDRAIGIAGVMGGQNSEVSGRTQQVILESAAFDAPSVRRTGQRLGLRSEAQQRFEKGIDPAAVTGALVRATSLLSALAGAEPDGGIVAAGGATVATGEAGLPVDGVQVGPSDGVIAFSPARCNALLGTAFTETQMRDVFRRLGLRVVETASAPAEWQVVAPSRRPDLQIEADLAEEIGRICGFDAVPSTLPTGATTVGVRNRSQRLRKATREVLLGVGLTEVYTYTFSHPDALLPLRLQEHDPLWQMIPLLRPLSEERVAMRTHLLPGLAQVALHNLARGVQGGQVFEMGKVYLPKQLPLGQQPSEPLQWAGLWFGSVEPVFGERDRAYDFADVKGAVEVWLDALGLSRRVGIEPVHVSWLHPGRAAQVKVDGRTVGSFGELHPETAAKLDLQRALYAQFDLDALIDSDLPRLRVQSLPRYPASRRDLAVVVDDGVQAQHLVTLARKTAADIGDYLESCAVFDVYTGPGVAEGKKSLALALTYRALDRTLTDEEVERLEQVILGRWQAETGATLRTS